MKQSPIVITGMHRSGTSLLSKIFLLNNVQLGSKLDVNYESIYFQRINKWILSCNGSSWDNPGSLNDIDDYDKIILTKKLINVINNRFNNSLYFGLKNMVLNNSFFNQSTRWGWKDPVNTFSLYIWKEIFPDIKIINIVRDPLDVCASLLIRQKNLQEIDMSYQKKIFKSNAY